MSDGIKRKGEILKRLIESATAARKDSLAIGKEIEKYGYNKDHDFQYSDYKEDYFFKATVAKTAEYIETVGPALYQQNPDRRVATKPWAGQEAQARNSIIQDLLNYTPRETNLSGHSRRSINDAIVFGAGVAWTGYNPRKKLIQTVYDSVENLVLDPDAKYFEEVNWGGRKRVKPKWWLTDRYKDIPGAADVIAALRTDEESASGSAKSVTFYELYFRIGLHHLTSDGRPVDTQEIEGKPTPITSDAPKKYIVSEDGKIIAEMEWEAPLFLDDRWPFEVLTFRDRPKSLWGVSPLETGLGFQKALNWIYTLYISKARFTTRTLLGIAKYNGEGLDQEAVQRALRGSQIEVIEFEINGEQIKLGDLLQQFNFSTGVEEFERFVAIIERAFERATGLTELVAIGESDRQFRSAAEASLKDRNSRTRFEDMRTRVETWATNIARKEALMSRFLLTAEDIGEKFGQEAGQMWGALVPPMNLQIQALKTTAQQMGMTDPGQIDQYIATNVQEGVEFQTWLLETDLEIESGSTRKLDISQQQDAANTWLSQVAPQMFSAGLLVPALIGMKGWAKLHSMPAEIQAAMDMAIQQAQMPPPLPVQPAGPGPVNAPAPEMN